MLKRPVTCPYCKCPAELVDSKEVYGGKSYGMIWLCRPCEAYVGTHKNSPIHAPKGRLANRELRELRIAAHEAFDATWKGGQMSRSEAYVFLAEIMGMQPQQAHIGKFDEGECRKLLARIEKGGLDGFNREHLLVVTHFVGAQDRSQENILRGEENGSDGSAGNREDGSPRRPD